MCHVMIHGMHGVLRHIQYKLSPYKHVTEDTAHELYKYHNLNDGGSCLSLGSPICFLERETVVWQRMETVEL